MNSESEDLGGRVRLPGIAGAGQDTSGPQPGLDRREGIRHARRVSNWTAAALIVGAGGATLALAHQALPATATAPAAGTANPAAAAGTASAAGSTGPRAAHSVATTSASGVTVTTTTRTVNGKTIVTHVRHAPAYRDN